jgi:tripartite-type tricarboxylate transporter receptor subunit TctC
MRILLFLLAALWLGSATAQYPNKPLRLIVPFAPGGSTDIFARLIAERAQAPLGQPIVVENRAGAAGNTGAEAAVRSAPDGYTLLMATTGVMAINNALYKNMTYDAAKDLEPVIYVASITNVLIVPPDLPAKNVAELIAMAKKEPGKLTFASSGAGASTHMSAELFKNMTGTDILHVPYKGSGPAMPDLMSGRVSMMFENAPGAVPHIKAGKVRALAQTGLKRSPAMPDVPTLAESGVPGYDFVAEIGFYAPAGAPREVVSRLAAEAQKAVKQPDVAQRFKQLGIDPVGSTPQAYDAANRASYQKYERVVKASGAKID